MTSKKYWKTLLTLVCLAGLLFGLTGCASKGKKLESSEYQFEALSPEEASPLLNWEEMTCRTFSEHGPSFSGTTERISLKDRFRLRVEFDLSTQRVDEQQEYQNIWLVFTTNVKEKEPEKGTYMFVPLAGATDFYNGHSLGGIGVANEHRDFADFAGKHIMIEASYTDRHFTGKIYADGEHVNTFSSSSFDRDGSHNKTFSICGNNAVIENLEYKTNNSLGIIGMLLLALIQLFLLTEASRLDRIYVNHKNKPIISAPLSYLFDLFVIYAPINMLYHHQIPWVDQLYDQNTGLIHSLLDRLYTLLQRWHVWLERVSAIDAWLLAGLILIIIVIRARFHHIPGLLLHLIGSAILRLINMILLVILAKSLRAYNSTAFYLLVIFVIFELLCAWLDWGADGSYFFEKYHGSSWSSSSSGDDGSVSFPDKLVHYGDGAPRVLYLVSNQGNYAVYNDEHGDTVTIHSDMTDDDNNRYTSY